MWSFLPPASPSLSPTLIKFLSWSGFSTFSIYSSFYFNFYSSICMFVCLCVCLSLPVCLSVCNISAAGCPKRFLSLTGFPVPPASLLPSSIVLTLLPSHSPPLLSSQVLLFFTSHFSVKCIVFPVSLLLDLSLSRFLFHRYTLLRFHFLSLLYFVLILYLSFTLD